MPRKRQTWHWYGVYVISYADEAIRIRVERGEEVITQPTQITAQSFYMGSSRAQAERNFSRAALSAMNNPLAFAVVMEQDSQVIIRVRIEH